MPDISSYLLSVTNNWNETQSSGMTIGLRWALLLVWPPYVQSRLTIEMIREKKGRPVLNYAIYSDVRNGVLQHMLLIRANPNERCEGASILAHFLRWLPSAVDWDHAAVL